MFILDTASLIYCSPYIKYKTVLISRQYIINFATETRDLIMMMTLTDDCVTSSDKVRLLSASCDDSDHGDVPESTVCTADEADAGFESRTVKRRFTRNLIAFSLSYLFLSIGYLSLRNLQSSLYAVDNLGMYALSCWYTSLLIGCICATNIVRRLGPCRSMLISAVGLTLYDLANLYPTFQVLLPASLMVGFFLGVFWTANGTYRTQVADSYSESTGDTRQRILTKVNGTFFFFHRSAQIIGGLFASLILDQSSETSRLSSGIGTTNSNNQSSNQSSIFSHADNTTRNGCGAKFCPHLSSTHILPPDPHRALIFMCVMAILTMLGGMILMFGVESTKGDRERVCSASVWSQLGAIFVFFYDRRVVCLTFLMVYNLNVGFMFSEFAQV